MKINFSSLRRIVFTIFLFFPAVFCLAATYYISPTGNDATGNGTIGNPWRTLFKATSTVTAGNIIHVNAGTYTETLQCNLAVGVSIEGAGRATTIIRSNITGQWSTLLQLNSGQNTNGNQRISGITIDGQYVSESNNKTWIGIWVTGRSNVLINDCSIINFRDRGVIFDGNNVTDPVTDPGNYATGNKFYNNTVLNAAAVTANYGSGMINIGGQQGMEIYGNTMIQNQRVAFKNGWPIKYWDNGWLKGCKIYNNTLTKAAYQGSYPGENSDWDFAIELFNIEGLEIYGNTIQGSIDLNYNRKGAYAFCAWIHNNIVGRSIANPNFESGIILEFRTEHILIEHNVFNNTSSGVQFNTRTVNQNGGYPNPGGGTPAGGFSYLLNNVIRNNLFSNIYQGNGVGTATGIAVISESGNDPQINGLDIYNNTIVAKAGDAPWIGIDFTSGENGNATNVNIRNNIVNGFNDRWLKGSSATNMSNVMVSHNNPFGNGNGNLPGWPGGNPVNYTYNNNTYVNPQFISATDFNLQPTSPLIDIGVFVGTPFNGNGPDKGYVEFGAVILPVTLIDFTVKENAGKNILNWNTASESNSSYFSIERSTDAQHYTAIGSVPASGNSSSEIKYSFTDANPSTGINYYRLVLMDKDGKFEYSKIVSINNKAGNSIGIVRVDLSSASNTASMIINSSKSQTAHISIVDLSGRIILNAPVFLQKGNSAITKNIPAISKGIYYVRLFTADETVVKNTFSTN
ncbi:MAG: T9SS type A sorting domain-containing protein [Chitinophagaceae bacterium]|nr:T9SS type A sorting domain-containing protein [Chitinophagaceae bacterium]